MKRRRWLLAGNASAHQRVFIGRLIDNSAVIDLFDPNGRPRIYLTVDQDGQPRIEFLDAGGKVLQSLPSTSGATTK